jgi:DNA-binding response OmpR family regulator
MTLVPPRRVLLLEDDRALRVVLQDALTAEGYEVSACASLEEVLSIAQPRLSDLLVADFWGHSHHVLGDEDRMEIARLGALLPVLLITGRSWADRSSAEELGIAALLRKPFELDTLLQAIEQAHTWWQSASAEESGAAESQA